MSEHSPLITIITVVYNDFELIEKTILSVINQSYKNFEYIIIDGKSTDGTADVIMKYESHIQYWQSRKDEGIYDAMNIGITHSKGMWVNFMNSGDTFADNTILEKITAYCLDNYNVIYGDTIVTDKITAYISKSGLARDINSSMPCCHQSIFVRKTLLADHPFDLYYKVAADFAFFAKTFRTGKQYKKIDIPTSIYDSNGYSSSNYLQLFRERSEILLMYGHLSKISYLYRIQILLRIKIFKNYLKNVWVGNPRF